MNTENKIKELKAALDAARDAYFAGSVGMSDSKAYDAAFNSYLDACVDACVED